MKGTIYKYTFPDGKVYIGQTRRHPEKRKREHFDENIGPTNSGFWAAYKSQGEPEYEEILEIERDDEDELVNELNDAESFFIQIYNADNPLYGYNKKSYGTARTRTNLILNEKYSEMFPIFLEKRLGTYFSAKYKILDTKESLTDDELFLIKEKYRDKNLFQRGIDDYDLENLNNRRNYDENKEFFLEEGLEMIETIITMEVQEEVNKFIADNYIQILQEARDKNAIVQLDKEGNFIKEYYSFNEICQAFNVPRADNVMNVLRGKQKSAYGYLWKYKRDI